MWCNQINIDMMWPATIQVEVEVEVEVEITWDNIQSKLLKITLQIIFFHENFDNCHYHFIENKKNENTQMNQRMTIKKWF